MAYNGPSDENNPFAPRVPNVPQTHFTPATQTATNVLAQLIKQYGQGSWTWKNGYYYYKGDMSKPYVVTTTMVQTGMNPDGSIQYGWTFDIQPWGWKPQPGDNTPGGGGGFGGGGGGGGPSEELINQWLHVAAVYGVDATRDMVIANINKGMPFQTWQDKIIAVHQLNTHQKWFDQFEQTLRAQGLAKNFDTNARLQFINGLAEPKFYDVWREASIRGALAQQGVTTMNKGQALGDENLQRAAVQSITGDLAGMSVEQIRAIAQNYAQTVVQTGAYGRFLGPHISERDVLKAAAGTASRGTMAKIASLLSTEKAFQTAELARPQLQAAQGGGVTLTGLLDQSGQSL